jgi:hypothetical protein
MLTALILVLAAGWYVLKPYLDTYVRRGQGELD